MTSVPTQQSPAETMQVLARNVARLREAKGWHQGQLAAAIGVSRATINRIEQGHTMPTWAIACDIADALEASTEDLRSEKS
jgi:DNA-binding XRE family transcriptional regulator